MKPISERWTARRQADLEALAVEAHESAVASGFAPDTLPYYRYLNGWMGVTAAITKTTEG